jgi:hypothetical protein
LQTAQVQRKEHRDRLSTATEDASYGTRRLTSPTTTAVHPYRESKFDRCQAPRRPAARPEWIPLAGTHAAIVRLVEQLTECIPRVESKEGCSTAQRPSCCCRDGGKERNRPHHPAVVGKRFRRCSTYKTSLVDPASFARRMLILARVFVRGRSQHLLQTCEKPLRSIDRLRHLF